MGSDERILGEIRDALGTFRFLSLFRLLWPLVNSLVSLPGILGACWKCFEMCCIPTQRRTSSFDCLCCCNNNNERKMNSMYLYSMFLLSIGSPQQMVTVS